MVHNPLEAEYLEDIIIEGFSPESLMDFLEKQEEEAELNQANLLEEKWFKRLMSIKTTSQNMELGGNNH